MQLESELSREQYLGWRYRGDADRRGSGTAESVSARLLSEPGRVDHDGRRPLTRSRLAEADHLGPGPSLRAEQCWQAADVPHRGSHQSAAQALGRRADEEGQ